MENKKFTKADLKVGYVVKFRRGDLRMIMPASLGKLVAIASDGTNGDISKYRDDLTHRYGEKATDFADFDIMEVYGLSCWDHEAYMISTSSRELLWKREEAKKMTVEEIEKELGYKIEIVS